MASAFLIDDFKGHATAILVVLDIFPQIMREMIANIFPPKGVLRQIQNEPNQTFMKQLATSQKKMILKLDSTGYNDLDISCLYKIIRYFNLLPPPTEGWGKKPKPEDQREGDDVERMKMNRNDIIHRPRGGLSESERNSFFQQSIEIAKRMDSRIGSPQNGFESKIKNVQSYIVSQEQYIKALEKCATYQARLQETAEAPCFNLHYGNDIKIKIDTEDEDETKGDSSSSCTIYLKDPDFDENYVIQKIDAIKEMIRIGDYAILLEDAESGSLNLHVSIQDICFKTKEILHKSIQYFLYEFFRAASLPCIRGQIFTVVLAESVDLVSDNRLTKQDDVGYLKEIPSPIVKFNVKVKDSAFINEFELYRQVNRFISGMSNAVVRHMAPVNGSAREVLMLTANESDGNSPHSLNVIADPAKLRMGQEAVVNAEESNYFKISTLVLRIAPRAVRIKFDDVFGPQLLKETLDSYLGKLTELKKNKCINQVQWNLMFPSKGDPTSESFGTTLMICLFRNLADIQITDQLPYETDYSIGADLSRIKTYRNVIAYSNDIEFTNAKFTQYWNDTVAAVVRLSEGILNGECSNLRTKTYAVADKKTFLRNIQEHKTLVQIENENNKQDRSPVVAAIDFGTTYSGLAFSHKREHAKIITKQWHSSCGAGLVSFKTPTSILLDPENKFCAFGYEAEGKYDNLSSIDDHGRWHFFKHFKMELHSSEILKRETVIRDVLGNTMPAFDIFTHSIRYLKQEAEHLMIEQGIDVIKENISWIITVPAIWNDAAKQFMREAAEKASIPADKLTLALEPEVAGIYILHVTQNLEKSKGGSELVKSAPGSTFMVVDIGGGTVDITVMETATEQRFKQISLASGGPCGGKYVNDNILKYLASLVGEDVMETYRVKNMNDYYLLSNEIEFKKRRWKRGRKLQLELPLSLIDHFEDMKTASQKKVDLKRKYELQIHEDIAEQFTLSVVSDIISHVRETVGKVKDISFMVIVGGFADNSLLIQEFNSAFPKNNIIIPDEAGLAVLKGAVLFGRDPSCVITRKCDRTYGTLVYRTFLKDDLREKRVKEIDGDYCKDAFNKLVGIGESISVNEKRSTEMQPIREGMSKMSIKLYGSTEPNPRYVTDRSCTYLGKIVVDIPHQWRNRDENVIVSMTFGQTEVVVEGKSEHGEHVVTTKLDFLV